jgi:hypothetical protein
MRRFSYSFTSKLIQGFPAHALDFSLLFRAANLKRRSGFPSYSWAGWRGAVDFARSFLLLHERDDLQTWIKWYHHEPGESLTSVRRSYFTNEITGLFPYRIFQDRFVETEPNFVAGISNANLDVLYPLLLFFTLTISLKVAAVDAFPLEAQLVGRDSTVYAWVQLAQVEDDQNLHLQVGSIVELALILRYRPFTGGDFGEARYGVLLIEWNGNIAERRGSGSLLESGLLNGFMPGPKWREIVLG